jgi:integrase
MGLRPAEVCGLRWEDVDFENATIVIADTRRFVTGEAYTVSGYALVHEAGDAFTIKQLRRRAYRLMEPLGLRRVRLYDARSSCLTFLADNGVPDHILTRWAGHTNIQTTKRWYVKPDLEDLRGVATTWNDMHGFGGEGS